MLKFEWDEEKNQINRAKHGWDFDEASQVFGDPFSFEVEDRPMDYGERRYKIIGLVGARLVTVVFTERDNAYRLISAYKASPQERRDYEDNKT